MVQLIRAIISVALCVFFFRRFYSMRRPPVHLRSHFYFYYKRWSLLWCCLSSAHLIGKKAETLVRTASPAKQELETCIFEMETEDGRKRAITLIFKIINQRNVQFFVISAKILGQSPRTAPSTDNRWLYFSFFVETYTVLVSARKYGERTSTLVIRDKWIEMKEKLSLADRFDANKTWNHAKLIFKMSIFPVRYTSRYCWAFDALLATSIKPFSGSAATFIAIDILRPRLKHLVHSYQKLRQAWADIEKKTTKFRLFPTNAQSN